MTTYFDVYSVFKSRDPRVVRVDQALTMNNYTLWLEIDAFHFDSAQIDLVIVAQRCGNAQDLNSPLLQFWHNELVESNTNY